MTARSALLLALIAAGAASSTLSSAFTQDAPGSPTRNIEITITEGTNFMAVASPDRESIAIDVLGALWVLPMRGGPARRVTPEAIEARNPSWAADSRSLAFQAYDDNNWHIHTINVDGSNLKALTSGPFDDQDPDWSPDGQSIAFSSDRFGGILTIWQVDVGSGSVQQLSKMQGRDPCWAVSAVTDRDVIFLGPPAQPPPAPQTPAWWVVGPGGREVLLDVFVPLDRRTQGVVACASGRTATTPPEPRRNPRAGRSASPAPLAPEDVFPFRAQWIAASDLLYTGDGHIKRRPLNGPGTVIPFSATLTLHRSIYASKHRDLQPATQPSTQSETPVKTLGIASPAVSPDGSMVAFTALSDLWVLPIGQGPIRITNDPNVELDPAWSPDGAQLAFSSDRNGQMELWVHNFKTGTDLQLTKEQRRVTGAAWSPDGRDIAFTAGRGSNPMVLTLAGGGGGTVRRLGAQSGLIVTCAESGGGRPTWGPGPGLVAIGKLLCYTVPGTPGAGDGTSQLALYSDAGSNSTAVLRVHHSAGNRENGGPVWSPDGDRIAYVSEGRLWTQSVDPNGKPLGDAIPVAEDTPSFPSWEGDSRRLVYLTPTGLRRVPAAGGTPEPIDVELSWLGLRSPDRVVVHAGTLFDGRTSNLRYSVDVLIEGGRIRDIRPHDNDLHTGRVIDASNQTVMPGLIDANAHLDPSYGETMGRIWLAYGVTSVRDPEAEAYSGLEMRESYDAGRRLGPRLFIAGDPFSGIRVSEAGGTSIGSPAQLELELARALRLNYDAFSTGTRLPDKYQQRITTFAHEHGIAVLSSQLMPAAVVGVDGLTPLRERSRRGSSARVSGAGISYADVTEVIVKSGLAFTPALAAAGAFSPVAARDRRILEDDPRLELFPNGVVESLRSAADYLRRRPQLLALQEESLKPLYKSVGTVSAGGGKIVAGTDASDSVPYGLSLHVELEQFVKAGLSPLLALQTATVNAAEALGVSDDLGTIEPGKLADLVFVDGNPLQDIKTTRNVKGVMRGGWYYDLPALGISTK